MAILDKVYEWVKKLKPLKKTPIPSQIREELMFMFICWPFVHSNIRWPISGTLSATDATTQVTAGVSSEVPGDLAHALYRLGEHRREQARLDWDPLSAEAAPTNMARPHAVIDEVAAGLSWTFQRKHKYARRAHVNLLELRAVKAELKERAKRQQAKEALPPARCAGGIEAAPRVACA